MKKMCKKLCVEENLVHWRDYLLFQGTDTIEAHYPNITRPYRPRREQCSQASHRTRYSTEPGPGWGGGTPLQDIESNHIEGAIKSKVSRSSSPSREESMSLSGSTSHCQIPTLVLLLSIGLCWLIQWDCYFDFDLLKIINLCGILWSTFMELQIIVFLVVFYLLLIFFVAVNFLVRIF